MGVIIITLSLFTLSGYYKTITKPQWRQVVTEVESNAGYGDVFIVYPKKEMKSVDYYKTREDLVFIPMRNKFPQLKNLGQKSVWVVMHAHPENRRLIKKGLSGAYNFELEKPFVGLDLYRLTLK